MCIFHSVLRLKPFLEEAWTKKVWEMSLLKRMVRVELKWACYPWTTKFCSQRPFVCIPKMTSNIMRDFSCRKCGYSCSSSNELFQRRELVDSVFHPGEANLKSTCYWACEFTYVRFAVFDISLSLCMVFVAGFETENMGVHMGQNGENSASSYFLWMVG